MDNAITQPAAAFVHRSRHDQLRTLLSVAWIVVAGLAVSIAIRRQTATIPSAPWHRPKARLW
jgi:hypothetical protein